MTNNCDNSTLVRISRKAFIQVILLLAAFLAASIILTWIIPSGSISVIKGVCAPVLVFFSGDGPALIMLCLFLIILTAAFQTLSDAGGIGVLIGYVSDRFKDRGVLLIASTSFVFMCFGAFLGLFEEMLVMLPVMAMLFLTAGYDSFTGFLVCIISCGFGFASAITNPFTVLLASEIIGANPTENIWYRLVIFAAMYLLLLCFILIYVGRLKKDPSSSLTAKHDARLREASGRMTGCAATETAGRKSGLITGIFLAVSLAVILVCSMSDTLRSYVVVVLSAYFLIFGFITGILCTGSVKKTAKSFLKGLVSGLPTICFIAMASSIKYVFEEGGAMPAVAGLIDDVAGHNSPALVAVVLYAIILVLEFFISSSTAKAILVMGLLSMTDLGLTKQMSVLIYTFADGYTNVLFPTSPVLLIALSMIEVDYLKWVKKSSVLFIINLLMVLCFLLLGIVIGY